MLLGRDPDSWFSSRAKSRSPERLPRLEGRDPLWRFVLRLRYLSLPRLPGREGSGPESLLLCRKSSVRLVGKMLRGGALPAHCVRGPGTAAPHAPNGRREGPRELAVT